MEKKIAAQLNNLPKYPVGRTSLKEISKDPGIYMYRDIRNTILYVGKSKKLHDRLESYLSDDVPVKTKQLMSKAKTFSVIKVGSEIEALLLEAELVKQLQPKYNIELKDDKHPLYIKITKERYPRILTARKYDNDIKSETFGPFPSSSVVKSVLKFLRKIFPYAQHQLGKRACFYSQIGLCSPCPNVIERTRDDKTKTELLKEYKKNIRNIRYFLRGDLKVIKHVLEADMKQLSQKELFESANKIKLKIDALNYITQPVTPVNYFLENPFYLENSHHKETQDLSELIHKYYSVSTDINRIECYDIAHLQGSFPTASMVTFISAEPDKTLYRHFKIRQTKGNDDYSSMKEVASRRKKYLSSWGIPDLIVVDGGKGQVSVFTEIFSETGIPIVGLAKRFERLVVKNNITSEFMLVPIRSEPALHLLQRLRDEAHRFARRYHHQLLSKELQNSNIKPS